MSHDKEQELSKREYQQQLWAVENLLYQFSEYIKKRREQLEENPDYLNYIRFTSSNLANKLTELRRRAEGQINHDE